MENYKSLVTLSPEIFQEIYENYKKKNLPLTSLKLEQNKLDDDFINNFDKSIEKALKNLNSTDINVTSEKIKLLIKQNKNQNISFDDLLKKIQFVSQSSIDQTSINNFEKRQDVISNFYENFPNMQQYLTKQNILFSLNNQCKDFNEIQNSTYDFNLDLIKFIDENLTDKQNKIEVENFNKFKKQIIETDLKELTDIYNKRNEMVKSINTYYSNVQTNMNKFYNDFLNFKDSLKNESKYNYSATPLNSLNELNNKQKDQSENNTNELLKISKHILDVNVFKNEPFQNIYFFEILMKNLNISLKNVNSVKNQVVLIKNLEIFNFDKFFYNNIETYQKFYSQYKKYGQILWLSIIYKMNEKYDIDFSLIIYLDPFNLKTIQEEEMIKINDLKNYKQIMLYDINRINRIFFKNNNYFGINIKLESISSIKYTLKTNEWYELMNKKNILKTQLNFLNDYIYMNFNQFENLKIEFYKILTTLLYWIYSIFRSSDKNLFNKIVFNYINEAKLQISIYQYLNELYLFSLDIINSIIYQNDQKIKNIFNKNTGQKYIEFLYLYFRLIGKQNITYNFNTSDNLYNLLMLNFIDFNEYKILVSEEKPLIQIFNPENYLTFNYMIYIWNIIQFFIKKSQYDKLYKFLFILIKQQFINEGDYTYVPYYKKIYLSFYSHILQDFYDYCIKKKGNKNFNKITSFFFDEFLITPINYLKRNTEFDQLENDLFKLLLKPNQEDLFSFDNIDKFKIDSTFFDENNQNFNKNKIDDSTLGKIFFIIINCGLFATFEFKNIPEDSLLPIFELIENNKENNNEKIQKFIQNNKTNPIAINIVQSSHLWILTNNENVNFLGYFTIIQYLVPLILYHFKTIFLLHFNPLGITKYQDLN